MDCSWFFFTVIWSFSTRSNISNNSRCFGTIQDLYNSTRWVPIVQFRSRINESLRSSYSIGWHVSLYTLSVNESSKCVTTQNPIQNQSEKAKPDAEDVEDNGSVTSILLNNETMERERIAICYIALRI